MSKGLLTAHSQEIQPPNRIWRLQFGPCRCSSGPTASSSFDYMRLRRTRGEFGTMRDNLLIVSERVIDGSAAMHRQVYSTVPDPKVVVATGTCPMSHDFWDDLPNGWIPVEEVLPVDIRVDDCVNGKPEALVAAILSHLFTQQVPNHRSPQDDSTSPEALRPNLQAHNA